MRILDTQPQAKPLPTPAPDDKRWKLVVATMRKHGYAPDALIEALHAVQDAFGYLDDDSLRFAAAQLHVPLSQVYGVATFYHIFTLKPAGAHRCVVCQGTACYIKGCRALLEALEATYDIHVGETTRDGQISLLGARCLGACSMAPAAVLDDDVHGALTPDRLLATLKQWSANGHDA
jgi:bidirectional [NiFe] hydrogenase diaphorase subunit